MKTVKEQWKVFATLLVVLGIIGYFVFGYVPKERGSKESSSSGITIEGVTDNQDNGKPSKKTEKEENEKELAAARQVAEDFSSAYFQFNGDVPNENLLNASAFVTGGMLDEIKDEGQVARPLDDLYKLKLTHLTSTIEEDINMYAEVTLTGDFYSVKGKKMETVSEVYHLKIEQGDDGIWRVSQFSIDHNRD